MAFDGNYNPDARIQYAPPYGTILRFFTKDTGMETRHFAPRILAGIREERGALCSSLAYPQ